MSRTNCGAKTSRQLTIGMIIVAKWNDRRSKKKTTRTIDGWSNSTILFLKHDQHRRFFILFFTIVLFFGWSWNLYVFFIAALWYDTRITRKKIYSLIFRAVKISRNFQDIFIFVTFRKKKNFVVINVAIFDVLTRSFALACWFA